MEKNAYNSEWEWLLRSKAVEPDEALVVVKGCRASEKEDIIAKAVNLPTAKTIAEEHNQVLKLQPGEMPDIKFEVFKDFASIQHNLAWALKAFQSTIQSSNNSPLAALRDAIGLECAVWILFGHESSLGEWIGGQKRILARKAGVMLAGR